MAKHYSRVTFGCVLGVMPQQQQLLKAYANLPNTSADPLRPLCAEEPQAIEYLVWKCPRLDATQQNIFASPSPLIQVLTTEPETVLALARGHPRVGLWR